MSTIVIAGGSVSGLATALALAGSARRVVVLETSDPPPEGSPGRVGPAWIRPTVPQAQHSHTLTSLGVAVLRERAPNVIAEAVAANAELLDLVAAMPPAPPARLAGDEELVALACRRTTLELVLYRIVRTLPAVEIRHRTRVRGLVLNRREDRVAGVVVDRGDRIPAQIVIDATGRRAAARAWLRAAGIGLREDLLSPSGLLGFTRFYQRLGPPAPLNRGNAAGILGDHYLGVLHPGDDGTFSVALGVLPEDRTMRSLRRPGSFHAVARATPGVAAWLADGAATPISGVHAITCPPNVLRALAIARPQPVAGLLPAGDAACITNPLYGRGQSLAFAHAFRLADLLAAHPDPGPAQAEAAVRIVRDLFLPWYEQAAREDGDRIRRWRAGIKGDRPPPEAAGLTLRTVSGAASSDSVVWRELMRVLMCLRPPAEVFGDAEFSARVRRALGAVAPRPPLPTRGDLVAAAAGGQ